MQKKLAVLFILVLLAFVGLGIRLLWISHEKGNQYSKEILKQQDYESVTLPFKRGDIVDAKGTKLAVSEKFYNLVIDASVVNYKEEYVEPTLQALAQCYPQLDMQAIRKHVTTNKDSKYYIPLRLLTYEQKHAFEQYKEKHAEETEQSLIKGVWFEEVYKRIYPYSTLACDVIGFTGKDNVGSYGLEEYYNDILNGTNGREYGYLGDDSLVERTIKPAVDGYTIHSTIDANIQGIVEKYLFEFNEENKNAVRTGNGAENVGCIIMEVDTGNILAMASYPNFDLNYIYDKELFEATERCFENVVNKRMYITGATGSTCHGESFTIDYDLPNRDAYAETCAAISLAFFAIVGSIRSKLLPFPAFARSLITQ